MKVLVVDDSRTTRMILRKMLTGIGHQVVEAADGQKGLTTLREGAPDLVLVDWNMPDMNGLEFIIAVRGDPSYAGVRLVMVTSESELSSVERALNAGADEYIMKPFDRETLIEKLSLIGL